MRDNERGEQFYIRGRQFHFLMPFDEGAEERQPNPSVMGDITQHID